MYMECQAEQSSWPEPAWLIMGQPTHVIGPKCWVFKEKKWYYCKYRWTRWANIPNLPKRLPICMYFCVSPFACLSSCCCSLISPYSNIKPPTEGTKKSLEGRRTKWHKNLRRREWQVPPPRCQKNTQKWGSTDISGTTQPFNPQYQKASSPFCYLFIFFLVLLGECS